MTFNPQQLIQRYMSAQSTVIKQLFQQLDSSTPNTMTPEQFQTICIIYDQGTCTPTYLADTLMVGKSSITAIVSRLADRGLVERSRDDSDRRQVYLSLTEAGQETYQHMSGKVHAIVSSYLVHFQEEEIESFISKFERLATLMAEGSDTK
ncbi:MarR family transcriptional regulator [Paenibacillus sp. ACRRX]|uniref:MarR family winged helix-turn-helix transcriptional regulator n=1 Tax=unclassified Paenibacillus TaxID=185978 RepID=UPI001EF6BFD8|nr:MULTISPECIES: MarR family transcriptional regulator [unclassified Paenibacillus]MCG7409806.1 MarR family transcriptional regulator [Paenibacillus sp. ACRRX]MDK8183126.1 MarR family transcriptional regulator [Paenibacillus sp. UMB4589-SE434]